MYIITITLFQLVVIFHQESLSKGCHPESGYPNVRITFRSPNPISASGGSNKILKMLRNVQFHSGNIVDLSQNEVT